MKFCVITKPGHNLGVRKGVEGLLKSLNCRIARSPKNSDFCVIIGGDGTLLYKQSIIRAPIIGIRTPGHAGHYLKASRGDFKEKIRRLVKGGYFIRELPRLEALVNGKRIKARALNEALVSPIYSRRMLESEVTIGGRKSLERNSGIVAYTPSGSNAFARSLGARNERFGVIPIAPFSGRIKGDMALGESLSVRILSSEAEICIDGQESQVRRLRRGDRVLVRRAREPARIVAFGRKF